MGVEGRPPELPMELRSPTDRVALKTVETNVAAVHGAVQMVFVPERELRPAHGVRAVPVGGGPPVPGQPRRDHCMDDPRERRPHRSALANRAQGQSGVVSDRYGCGDEVYVPVSVPFDDGEDDAVLIVAEVKPMRGAVIPSGGAGNGPLPAPSTRRRDQDRTRDVRWAVQPRGGPSLHSQADRRRRRRKPVARARPAARDRRPQSKAPRSAGAESRACAMRRTHIV